MFSCKHACSNIIYTCIAQTCHTFHRPSVNSYYHPLQNVFSRRDKLGATKKPKQASIIIVYFKYHQKKAVAAAATRCFCAFIKMRPRSTFLQAQSNSFFRLEMLFGPLDSHNFLLQSFSGKKSHCNILGRKFLSHI